MKVVAKSTIETYHMKDQLKNEVNILSKLSHPRIIQLYTIFEDHKNIYFVLELAEGVVVSNFRDNCIPNSKVLVDLMKLQSQK